MIPLLHKTKTLFATLALMLAINVGGQGQTNPAPVSLPYTQDFSGLPHNSTTYPAGWQGWTLAASEPGTTFRVNAPTADRVLAASSSANITTGGIHNYNGKIGFLNNASLDLSIVFAISTLGQKDVQVAYDIMTIRNPFNDTTNTRINEVTLQYRVGTTGPFTNLTGIEYRNDTITHTGTATITPQNLLPRSIILPAAVNDKPVVQLRWAARQISGVGSRPSFAVDNISVSGTLIDNTPPIAWFTPASGTSGVLRDNQPIIAFDEVIFTTTGIAVDNSNVSGLISLRENDATGAAVPFTATIDNGRNITVVPASLMKNGQLYYLAVAPVRNVDGSTSETQSATFTVIGENEALVTFSVIGANGTLTAQVGAAAIASGAIVQHGSDVVFTAVPAAGFRILGWAVNGVAAGHTNTTHTITGITAHATVTVEFELIPTYSVTFDVVDGLGNPITDATVTFDGVPDAASPYVFTGLLPGTYSYTLAKAGFVTSTGNVTVVDQSVTVSVTLLPVTYTVNFSVVGANGTLTAHVGAGAITSGGSVAHGSEVVFTVVPDAGFRVMGWAVNGVAAGHTNTTHTLTGLAANTTVTVEFEAIPTYSVTFNVVDGAGTPITDATVTFNGVLDATSPFVFTGMLPGTYSYTVAKVGFVTATGNVTVVDQNVTVSVTLLPVTYTVNFSVVGANGTLTAQVGAAAITSGAAVVQGSNVVFTAVPAAGFRVRAWVVNEAPVVNTSTTHTITGLAANTTVTVEFEPIPTYSVTFNVVDGAGTPITDAMITFNGVPDAVAPYVFTGMLPGTYSYTVAKTGFVTATGNVTVVDQNVTLSVTLLPVTYIVNFSVVGANGTLTAQVGAAAITSGATVAQGSNVVFTAVPNAGFRVRAWVVNEAPVVNTSTTHTITGLAANGTVTVEFETATGVAATTFTGFSAFPNPFSDLIRVSNSELVNRVVVTNLLGNTVIDIRTEVANSIDTSSLPAGIYIVTFEAANGERKVLRMVKK